MKAKRVCLAPGYKYQYDMSVPFASLPAPRNWRSSKDDHWDTIMAKAMCGKLLGRRRIDGVQVAVVQAGGKVYASQHIQTPKGVQMAGARRGRR